MCTAIVDERDYHRSKFSNLSSWKEEAWKKSGLQRDSSPWPPRYRCDALPTELWSHPLGARSLKWVHIHLFHIHFTSFHSSREDMNSLKWPRSQYSSVRRASHWYRGGHFQTSLFSVFFISFWNMICEKILNKLSSCGCLSLEYRKIILVFLMGGKEMDLLNYILISGKTYLWTCRCKETKPSFRHFERILLNKYQTEKYIPFKQHQSV